MTMDTRHFLTLTDLTPDELRGIVTRAIELKSAHRKGADYTPLKNKTLALIFDKSSTRTRVSFEAAMTHFGGNAIFLTAQDTQLGRGEPIEDTARVLSRMVDIVAMRTFSHDTIEKFAANSRVPVINALTDMFHPCQLLADVQTYQERRGDIAGATVAWIGDGNNVCHSWMNAARLFGFNLRVATPEGYGPNADLLAACASHVDMISSPADAAAGAAIVVTDTWASMGQEGEKTERMTAFEGYIVDRDIMAVAAADAMFMHCLPAYRGLEVAADVIDGEQSVVWSQAENRLHAQKALLEFLLST